jgi:type IV pilus assembly protein PilW
MTTAFSMRRRQLASSRGFSIVELMVSVVIGMLAIMFATRMVTGGEQTRQAALSGSDAMQNGVLAMFSISNDAGQAGFGLNDPLLVGCDTVFADNSGYTLAQATRGGVAVQPLAAALIVSGGAKSDTISLYSGSGLAGTATVRLLAAYTGGSYASVDRPPYGFAVNDLIVVAPESGGTQCSLAQVAVKPDLTASSPTLRFDAGADQRFNTGALNASFAAQAARIYDLGPAASLSFHTWSVNQGFLQLRATDMVGSGGTAATVADNIVSIKAQYGFDTRAGLLFTPEKGTTVMQWSATMIDADGDGTVGGAADYQRVVALRLAVVARSKVPERPSPGGTCSATVTAPTIFATAEPSSVAAAPIPLDVSVAGDIAWQCYRYRVFETIVPIRNAAWRPTA